MIFHYEAIVLFDPNLKIFPKASIQCTHLALLGVEMFFMISGFVILMTAERACSAPSFMLGRMARVYPAYVVSVIPAALANLAIHGLSSDLAILAIVNLSLLQAFIGLGDLITPYWTLAYELWFYIGMAVLVHFKLLRYITTLCLCWLITFLPLHVLEWAAVIKLPYRAHLFTFIDFGSFFIIGMMLYLLSTGRRSNPVLICLLLATVYNALGRWDWADVSAFSYLSATILFEIVLLLSAKSRIKILEAAPLVWLGRRSYSLYLLHMPLGLLLWAGCYHFGINPMAVAIIGVPLSIWLSSAFHQWIEMPGQNLLRRRFRFDQLGKCG